MGQQQAEDEIVLAGLTPKQRQVLDLLIEHKTSKEIARELGISPHTVDQRIQFAKEKLGASSRNEAAALYRRLLEICGPLTHQAAPLALVAQRVDTGGGFLAESPPRLEMRPEPRGRATVGTQRDPLPDPAVVPELFEGRYGTWTRLAGIVAIAATLVVVVSGGLAIIAQLSALMAG